MLMNMCTRGFNSLFHRRNCGRLNIACGYMKRGAIRQEKLTSHQMNSWHYMKIRCCTTGDAVFFHTDPHNMYFALKNV